jgi:hypothetical protein
MMTPTETGCGRSAAWHSVPTLCQSKPRVAPAGDAAPCSVVALTHEPRVCTSSCISGMRAGSATCSSVLAHVHWLSAVRMVSVACFWL